MLPNALRTNAADHIPVLAEEVRGLLAVRPGETVVDATDAPLDKRMATGEELTAAEVVQTWDERELETIFRRYGEERYGRQIARGIVRRRKETPIERTGQLVDVVRASIPAPVRFGD